jgi:hypothetical protein
MLRLAISSKERLSPVGNVGLLTIILDSVLPGRGARQNGSHQCGCGLMGERSLAP